MGESASKQSSLSPPWVEDSIRPQCGDCGVPFSLFTRRQHCRACGEIVCAQCTATRMPLPGDGYEHPVRVCETCAAVLTRDLGQGSALRAEQVKNF